MKKIKYNEKYDLYLKNFGLENIDKQKITINKYKKNEYIFYENEKINSMYILVDGSVKSFSISENGRNLIYGIYRQPLIFGEMEFISNKKFTTLNFIVSSKTAECIEIPIMYYKEWLLNEKKFLIQLSLELAKKLRTRDLISKITILYSLRERLCAYIVCYAKDSFFKTNFTDLSDIMGVSYRHLSREVKALVTDGIIEKQGTSYKILDEKQIRDICKTLLDNYSTLY